MNRKKVFEILNKLFLEAKLKDEFEYACAMLRCRGQEDRGWDPLQETHYLFTDLVGLAQSPLQDYARVRILLLLYCHLTEVDSVYEMIYNMTSIIKGEKYNAFPFIDLYSGKKMSGIPPSAKKVVGFLKEFNNSNGQKEVASILNWMFNDSIRNSFFHSDYILYGDEFRTRNGTFEIASGLFSPALPFQQLEDHINKGIKKTEEPKSEPSKETPPAKEPSTEERPAEETPTEPAPEQQTEPAPEPTPPASEPEPEPAVTGEIQVLGDESCQSRVGAALNFLESQASVHYTLANQYLSFIECGEVGSSINPATSQVRFTLGEATLTQGKMWIAGIIAHEYCHVKLYRDGQTYNGPVGETKCLEVQYDALEKMGADPVLLDYVKNLAETEWWSDPNRWW